MQRVDNLVDCTVTMRTVSIVRGEGKWAYEEKSGNKGLTGF